MCASCGRRGGWRVERSRIIGTRGAMRLHFPFWCPTKLTLMQEPTGEQRRPYARRVTYHFPLPRRGGGARKPLNFVHSEGFRYEIDEANRCIRQGLSQSPLLTHRDNLEIMSMIDDVRKLVGARSPSSDVKPPTS